MKAWRGGKNDTNDKTGRWLAVPANESEAQLRNALDQASGREADEVALRRVWARLADLPDLAPLSAGQGDQNGRRATRDITDLADLADLANLATASKRSRWPWIVAASLAGATAVLAFLLIETKSQVRIARVERVAQPAMVVSPGKGEAADQRSILVAPATVRTGLGEVLHLALRGGTEAVVTSESTLVLDQDDRPTVATGEVRFHVPPQPSGRTFAVSVGAYRVVVVGTRFRVGAHQSPQLQLNASVSVDEGVVEIWGTDHRIARIAAGESWASPVIPQVREDSAPHHSTVAKLAPAPGNKTTGTVRPSKSPRELNTPLATLRSGKSESGNSESGRSESGRIRQVLAMSSPSSSSSASVTSIATTGRNDGLLPLVTDVGPAVAPTAIVVPADIAAQARAAHVAGDFRRALDLYRALAQKGGTAGENAEYEIGRILRDGLHQPHEAVSAWLTYRSQHPRGLLRIETDISVIETLFSVGDKAGALAEASEFMRRYPESERRMEVARLVGDLLRERGDFTGAISAYDVAMGSGRARREIGRDGGRDVADGVSFHRSVCLLRGDRTDGVAALKTYLRSFPTGRFRGEAQRLLADDQPSARLVPRP